MAYRRFVTYLFRFKNGRKEANCGFAKVEVRQERVRMEVQVRGVPDGTDQVYLFVPESGALVGAYIGDLHVRDGGGRKRFVFGAESVGGTPYRMEEMAGIYIKSVGGFLGSQWVDEELDWGSFREYKAREEERETKKDRPTQDGSEAQKERLMQDGSEVQKERPMQDGSVVRENPSLQEECEARENPSLQEAEEAQGEKSVYEGDTVAAGYIQRSRDNGKTVREKNRLYLNHDVEKEHTANDAGQNASRREVPSSDTKNTDERPVNTLQQSSAKLHATQAAAAARVEIPQRQTRVSSYINIWERQWRQFTESHPLFCPFDEAPEILAVKMDLRDFKLLPKTYLPLANNSFLLHGYFNYKYLLFGYIDTEPRRWFLGVPGVFQNQEQLLAGLFGFGEFRTKHLTKQKTGEFGYWYRYLEF